MSTHDESEMEMWERELREAGWMPFVKRNGKPTMYIWVAPSGNLYRGPYGAWRMMHSCKQWGGQA